MIGEDELKIDLTTMEVLLKWLVHSNFTKVRSFVGVMQYLQNFIASFSMVVVPPYAITTSCKSF
jgi:hypothetical protein